MFGIDSSEFAVIALVALLVIGPKDLPRVMRMVGQWVARGRAMTRHVRAGFDTMMREAELEEMQKQWAAQNEAIMKATTLPGIGLDHAPPDQLPPASDDWMTPAPPLIPAPAAEAAPPPPARRRRVRDAAAPADTPADGAARARTPRARAKAAPAARPRGSATTPAPPRGSASRTAAAAPPPAAEAAPPIADRRRGPRARPAPVAGTAPSDSEPTA